MKYLLALVVIAGCSKKPAIDQEAAAAKIGELATRVCACTTKACAQQVNAELDAWTQEMSAKLGDSEDLEAPLELQNRVVDDLNKFSRCLTSAMKLAQ